MPHLDDAPHHEPAVPKFSIGVASGRTGLPASVIRTWEARYGAVSPERSPGGHRLYREVDLLRLDRLNRLVERGYRISRVADLPNEDLIGLLREGSQADRALRTGRAAAIAMDGRTLESVLRRTALELKWDEMLESVVLPLIATVERDGRSIAQPAYQAIRRFLEWEVELLQPHGESPGVMVVRPIGGQGGPTIMDELAARMLAVLAAAENWLPHILDEDLRLEEVGGALRTIEDGAFHRSSTAARTGSTTSRRIVFMHWSTVIECRIDGMRPKGLLGGVAARLEAEVAGVLNHDWERVVLVPPEIRESVAAIPNAMWIEDLGSFRDLLRPRAEGARAVRPQSEG